MSIIKLVAESFNFIVVVASNPHKQIIRLLLGIPLEVENRFGHFTTESELYGSFYRP